ncbi:MAG: pLS20_p028 family conjugation system transmembrane protein, partial [Paraclostridium sp.]
MSESKIMEILTSYSDVFGNVFEINSIFSDIIRSFIWGLIKILAIISNSIEGIIDQIYSLNGFFYSEGVTNLFKKLSPIIWVLLAISIGFIGYKLMFDREFKSEKIIQNILVAIIVVVMLPNLMLQLSNATIEGRKALDEIDETKMSMSANKVIKDNLYDLYYLDEFKFTNKSLKNNLKEDDIKYINICETVSDKKIENKDIFNQKIGTKTNGELELDKLDKTFFGLIKENYYRYKIDYIPVIVTLLCIIIALLSTVFKVSRIIFELGFVGIFGQLLAFSDIATGQKLKEVIKHIINTFIVLFLVSLILKMFLIFSSWLNDNESINMATKLVMLIGATISVVDGPNIIERILGIDSGVKSGWSVVMGGVASTKVAGQTAHTMGKLASNISSKISNLNKSDNKSNKSLNDEMNSMNNSSTDKKDTNESLSDQMRNSDIENESINRNQADSFDSNNSISSIESDIKANNTDNVSSENNINDKSANSINNSSNLDTMDSNESINRNQNDS